MAYGQSAVKPNNMHQDYYSARFQINSLDRPGCSTVSSVICDYACLWSYNLYITGYKCVYLFM